MLATMKPTIDSASCDRLQATMLRARKNQLSPPGRLPSRLVQPRDEPSAVA